MDLTRLLSRLKMDFPLNLDSGAEDHPQQAAVLVILYNKNDRTHILLNKRSAHLNNHAGEISFPGGMFEETDGDLLTTALRETEEELNLEIKRSAVLACLSQVTTRLGTIINPFVTLHHEVPRYKENPKEVEEVLEVPLAPLLATQQRDTGYPPEKNMFLYWYEYHKIWGATGKILNELGTLALG
jgi:8-oxo-dGTP pyrophosphatase MutT (NUDIX family)